MPKYYFICLKKKILFVQTGKEDMQEVSILFPCIPDLTMMIQTLFSTVPSQYSILVPKYSTNRTVKNNIIFMVKTKVNM